MNILDWINQGIDNLTQSSRGPGMDALGFHIFVALLTTMMVWFGVQEALSSAQGGPGFNFASLCTFVVVRFFRLHVHRVLRQRDTRSRIFLQGVHHCRCHQMLLTQSDRTASNQCKSDDNRHAEPTRCRDCEGADEYLLRSNNDRRPDSAGLLFGHDRSDRRLRSSRSGRHRILGPIFIPFLLVDKLSFLFWGWLRAFIGFSFYKVVAAAVLKRTRASLPAVLHEPHTPRPGHVGDEASTSDAAGSGESSTFCSRFRQSQVRSSRATLAATAEAWV